MSACSLAHHAVFAVKEIGLRLVEVHELCRDLVEGQLLNLRSLKFQRILLRLVRRPDVKHDIASSCSGDIFGLRLRSLRRLADFPDVGPARVLDCLVKYREVELLLLLNPPLILVDGRLLRYHSVVLRHRGGKLLGPYFAAFVDDVLFVHGDELAENEHRRYAVNHREVGYGLDLYGLLKYKLPVLQFSHSGFLLGTGILKNVIE